MEQGVKIYTFTYYTDEHSHSVEILLQIIIFVLTNMGDTYMYKAKGLIDSSMTYQIKLEIMLNLQIDYDTDWLEGASFVNGSVNNFSTVPFLVTPRYLSGVYHFIFRKVQMSDGGGSRFVYVIGLHADQFRNKVYSYGAKLFFTRHKPDLLVFSFTLRHFLVKYKLKLKENPSMICCRWKPPFQLQRRKNENANT